MTVLVSGHVADKLLRDANKRKPSYKPKPVSFGPGPLQNVNRREFLPGGIYHGLFKRIAKELGVCPGTVEMVSRGSSKSRRIMDAIVAEVRRVDAEKHTYPEPLSQAEHAEFSRRGKYYGVGSCVARALGMIPSNVGKVLSGKRQSRRVLAAIRAEMSRVDALPQLERISPLTPEEASEFKNGRKFYGLFTRVAKATGRHPATVRDTATRWSASQSMLRVLRSEMARVDAELSAKGGQ
jgi:hypothetical protein